MSLWRAPVSRRVSRLFMSVEDVSEETAAEVPVEELKDEAAEEGMEMADSVRPVPGRHRRGPKKEVRYQMADLTVGMEVEGSVRSTTNYGAFVDIGCTTDGKDNLLSFAIPRVSCFLFFSVVQAKSAAENYLTKHGNDVYRSHPCIAAVV